MSEVLHYFSGFTNDSILRVLQGENIGTLFHQVAESYPTTKGVSAREMAIATRECSRKLQV